MSPQCDDAIISTIREKELEADSGLLDAVEASNAGLAARGLYITHLFSERGLSCAATGWTRSWRLRGCSFVTWNYSDRLRLT